MNRTTSNPEILLANQVLLAEAKKAPTINPYLRDYNEVVYGNIGGAPDRGVLLDQPYADDNTGFIGSGARPKSLLVCCPAILRPHHNSGQLYG